MQRLSLAALHARRSSHCCAPRPPQRSPTLPCRRVTNAMSATSTRRGGGLRNDFGLTYAKVLLPAETIDNALDSWSGKITDRLRVGGDLRADWTSRLPLPIRRVSKPLRSSNSAFTPTRPSFRIASEYMSMNKSRRTARKTKKRTSAMATPRMVFTSRAVSFTCPSAGGCRTRPRSCARSPAST